MIRRLLAILLPLMVAMAATGQSHKRDPLSELEIEKIRDAAQLPEARLKLYIEFARARLEKIQQAHSDTKATDREKQTRDALQDFLDVYDELDTNVDTYADRGTDLRKALKPVIEADTEFGAKLRAFRASLAGNAQEARDDEFLIGSALEAVDSGAKDHRSLLAEQEEAFKHKKKQDHKEESSRHE
jgi:hypothetical protein